MVNWLCTTYAGHPNIIITLIVYSNSKVTYLVAKYLVPLIISTIATCVGRARPTEELNSTMYFSPSTPHISCLPVSQILSCQPPDRYHNEFRRHNYHVILTARYFSVKSARSLHQSFYHSTPALQRDDRRHYDICNGLKRD